MFDSMKRNVAQEETDNSVLVQADDASAWEKAHSRTSNKVSLFVYTG